MDKNKNKKDRTKEQSSFNGIIINYDGVVERQIIHIHDNKNVIINIR